MTKGDMRDAFKYSAIWKMLFTLWVKKIILQAKKWRLQGREFGKIQNELSLSCCKLNGLCCKMKGLQKGLDDLTTCEENSEVAPTFKALSNSKTE